MGFPGLFDYAHIGEFQGRQQTTTSLASCQSFPVSWYAMIIQDPEVTWRNGLNGLEWLGWLECQLPKAWRTSKDTTIQTRMGRTVRVLCKILKVRNDAIQNEIYDPYWAILSHIDPLYSIIMYNSMS